jgi:peptide/nickel transport system substrate-binding protein
VVVSGAEPPTLLPPFAFIDIHAALAHQLFWRLADVGPESTSRGHEGFVPRLARSWHFSPDSLTITFDIHPDARWHDGRPVTAHDVEFTFDIYRDSLVNSIARTRLSRIASVTAIDSGTVSVHFNTRYPEQFFDAVYHTRIIPRHVLDSIPRAALRDHPVVRNPVGNGPFRFRRWDEGESIELLADSSFFQGRPGIRRIVWRFGSDPQTMVTQLAAGEVDLLYPVTGIENLERLSRSTSVRLVEVLSNSYSYVGFNFRDPNDRSRPHPLLADARLRRAISMAVDRETIVRGVIGDAASVPNGPLTQGLWIWDAAIEQIPFDPDGARRLLSELGWSDSDGDGILNRGGSPLSFELLVMSTSIPRGRAAVILQEQLRQVGIDLVIQAIEPNAMFARVPSGNFDSYFGAWMQDPSPGSIEESWTTSGIGAGNYGEYSNPEVDRMIHDVQSEFNQDVAREQWKRIVGLINADAPAIWVYGGSFSVGIHDRFQDVSFPWDEWWKNLWTFRVDPARLIDRDLVAIN